MHLMKSVLDRVIRREWNELNSNFCLDYLLEDTRYRQAADPREA
jgi:hypothetical protein